jgi:hypothetical protein
LEISFKLFRHSKPFRLKITFRQFLIFSFTLSIIACLVIVLVWGQFHFVLMMNKAKKILKPVNFETSTALINPDSLDYAPGFPDRLMEATQQFEHFPNPQFRNNHQLLPNFLWMDPMYIGRTIDTINTKKWVNNSVLIQSQLAAFFNYYLLVNSNTSLYSRYQKAGSYQHEWIKLANAHPEWPTAAISFWAQLNNQRMGDNSCPKKNMLLDKKHADNLYITDKNTGQVIKRRWNPANHPDYYSCDFKTQQFYINELLIHLKRPLNFISENGEVFERYDETMLMNDSRIAKDKNSYPSLNWMEYQATKRLKMEERYRDAFMNDVRLKNTRYAVYAIDGMNEYRHDYGIMRELNTPIRGMNYSTPDFYPRRPDNWRFWSGPWHGMEWIFQSRLKEMSYGDSLFSPFVAAGWSHNETDNIRPAQWLSLMKMLHIMGAEFFYTGFFNTKKPFPVPANYIWQAVMPVYAQAAVSHAEDILLHGYPLNSPRFFYPNSNKNTVVLVRKHSNKERYLICTAIPTESNEKNAVPDYLSTELKLADYTIKLPARRQGCLFVLDLTQGKPVIYPIDDWHESSHPARWNKNIQINANLAENKVQRSYVVDVANKNIDATSNNSYLILNEKDSAIFSFHVPNNRHYYSIKVQSVNNKTAGQYNLLLNGEIIAQKTNREFVTINKEQLIEGQRNTLILIAEKESIHLTGFQLIHE